MGIKSINEVLKLRGKVEGKKPAITNPFDEPV